MTTNVLVNSKLKKFKKNLGATKPKKIIPNYLYDFDQIPPDF